ncbi:unnamed protein product [Fusarium graminearum]|nr:unnamed protein product [Fusarium graminearum]
MEALGVAASVIAVVDISVKLLQVCSNYAKEIKHAEAEIKDLRHEVANLHDTATKVKTLIEGPQGAKLTASQDFAHIVKECLDILTEVGRKLQPSSKRGFRRLGFKSLKWPFQSEDVHRTIGRINRCHNSLSLVLQVDGIALQLEAGLKLDNVGTQISKAHSKLDKFDDSVILSALPIAASAAYNSQAEEENSFCLKATRSELLQDIDDWFNDDKTETIFWLQGMAGTGKSTIARTVAKRWDEQNCLAASFFFKRGGGDRGNLSCFYTTIASQLATCNPSLASSIKLAIDQDSFVTSKMAEEQFDKLILQPILRMQQSNKQTIAIVIDALDECDGDESIRRLINIFTRTKLASNVSVRVLITSRPELHIRLGFRAVVGSYQDFVLHEIPQDIIKRDIRIFFTEKLDKILKEYNVLVEDHRKLPDTWPGPEKTEALVEKAVPLFIFAATVCRFLSQRRSASPDAQLQKVLAFETKSQESKMNATYQPTLEQQLEDLSLREQDEVVANFHQVVGTIILLETPLSVPALTKIIDVSEDSVYHRLDVLHSVLKYPKTTETPIRMLHLSFRDFLLDPEKMGNNRFWIDEEETHDRIASGCLRILNSSLKEDICNLVAPGTSRSGVPESRIASCISADLEYACRYWVIHLGRAPQSASISADVLLFLERHLLHFLECLSLIGRLSELYGMITILQGSMRKTDSLKLSNLLIDVHRFVQMNFTIIDQHPLQLYSSLCCAIPSESLLHPIFTKNRPAWILRLPVPSTNWDQHQHVLEGHKAAIIGGSFSPDNTHMASLSADGNLRVWRLDTGECIRELWIGEVSPHGGIPVTITDKPFLISTTIEQQLRLWSGETAELVGQYESLSLLPQRPQFSSCAQYCAFIDISNHVVVLHMKSISNLRHIVLQDSQLLHEGPYTTRRQLEFSPDSRHLAVFSCDRDGESFVWDIPSGVCIQKYNNSTIAEHIDRTHSFHAISVALCENDSITVAYVIDEEKTIWIRVLPSGEFIQALNGHAGIPNNARFLKKCTILGSSCLHGEFRTWNIETGQCLTQFLSFALSFHVLPSPNYQMACMFFKAQTIRLKSNSQRALPVKVKNDEDSMKRAALFDVILSKNKSLLAVVYESGMIRIWDVRTGDCVFRLGGDSFGRNFNEMPWLTPNFQYILFTTHETNIVLSMYSAAMGHLTYIPMSSFRYTTDEKRMIWKRDIVISPNGELIALVYHDTVCVSKVDSCITMHTIEVPGQSRDFIFSRDSKLVTIVSFTYSDRDDIEDHGRTCLSIFDTEKAELVVWIKHRNRIRRIVDIGSRSELFAFWETDCGYQVVMIDIKSKDTVIQPLCLDNWLPGVDFNRDFTMCAWLIGGDGFTISSVLTGQAVTRLSTGFSFGRVNFTTRSDVMSTNLGDIQLQPQKVITKSADHYDRVGLGLSGDKAWIMWNNSKLFWLPPAIRPKGHQSDAGHFVEVSGSTVMILSSSGMVVFFIFDVDYLRRNALSFTA